MTTGPTGIYNKFNNIGKIKTYVYIIIETRSTRSNSRVVVLLAISKRHPIHYSVRNHYDWINNLET